MTAREVAIGVLRMLIAIAAIGGVALIFEQLMKRRRPRYWMARDIHDTHRRNARNGVKAWWGTQ